jgi:serine protease Do
MKGLLSAFACAILILSICSVSGCKQQAGVEPGKPSASKSVTEEPKRSMAVISEDATALLAKINESLSAVSEVVKPSVVNISTTTTVSMKETPFGDFFNDPFLRKFFGDQSNPHGGKKKYKTSALGSGVIVTADGYILTNNHVVQNVDEIKVILQDKREFAGKLIGTDPQTDLAIVKVKTGGLPAIKIGDSGKLKVGELVIAVGNPFALGNTITMGIVSAVGRSHVGIADYEDFIQTDAAINPGNSGGALVNIRAELVGINTAIFSTSGGNVGIGFAIPASMAQKVMESIIKHGKVVRGWLGVSIQDLTPELIKHFNIKEGKGALIADVVKGGPAEKAGFMRGDLITAFDGEPVEDATSLRNMVAGRTPGKTVTVKIIREGKEISLSCVLGELPKTSVTQKAEYGNVMEGIYVQDITPEIRRGLLIPDKVTGVIVTNIDEESAAYEALKQNDVILEVNRKSIFNVKDYETLVKRIKPEDSVLLLVYRTGGFIYVTINP